VRNKISDLRDHLFEVIEQLKDKDHPMDLDRARAVADVAQVIVNSAKVEVAHMQVTGASGTGFIPEQPSKLDTQPIPMRLRREA
jgi:hypothetical protein